MGGRRLKEGSAGLKVVITTGALAATVVGWAVLAAAPRPSSPPPAAPADAAPVRLDPAPADDPDLPPMPELVSVDTRPLPPAPRPDVRTRASGRLR